MHKEGSLYRYTNRNLLNEPEYYMYSKFHGHPFLTDYIFLRIECVYELEKLYIECLKNTKFFDGKWFLPEYNVLFSKERDFFSSEVQSFHDNLIKKSQRPKISQKPSACLVIPTGPKGEIHTESVLRSLLVSVVNWDISTQDSLYVWLSRFLSRFEVTRKLYAVYTSDMKPATQDFHTLSNYALLSISLILYYEKTNNLKMVNGVLKLNDLLSSIRFDIKKPEDLFLAILSLHKEVKNIRELACRKGINI